MNTDLVIVGVLLVATVTMFAAGRPRMDVVALLVIIALPVLGILDIDETLSGFSDPNVLLIAALFVVGEGLARTGVTYRLGDLLAARAGASTGRLIVLLMLSVAGLGAVMSSTGVVAIFIPVVLSIAARTGLSARQLMMPLSFAALISGMLTLIATTPNLVIDAELRRAGWGLGFFTLTPYGLVVLALGIVYMLFAHRRLATRTPDAAATSRRTFTSLVDDFGIEARTHRYRVAGASKLVKEKLADVDLAPARGSVLAIVRTRPIRGDTLLVDPETRIRAGDALVINAELSDEQAQVLGLGDRARLKSFYDRFSREVGMAEFIVTPESRAIGRSARDLRFRERYGLTVLGVRHGGEARHGSYSDYDLRMGDTILVAGGWNAIKALQLRASDYVALDLPVEVREMSPAAPRAPYAVGAVVLMVVLMVSGIVPNVIAALIAAVLMGAFGVIDMGSAYRAIHWPTLLLIAGMFPIAIALEKTGGVDLVVDGLVGAFGGAAPRVMLAVFFVATAVIGLFVSNTATAILMAPIAIATAAQLEVSPIPFAITVALAASSAFMTPVSSPVNTLVVDPGRYTFGDFVRIGVPFTFVVLVVAVILVPLLAPF
jgi:di/tricarboxylate transporter